VIDRIYSSIHAPTPPQPFDLGDELTAIVVGKLTGNDISRTSVNPASNGRARDVQLWEKIPIPDSQIASWIRWS